MGRQSECSGPSSSMMAVLGGLVPKRAMPDALLKAEMTSAGKLEQERRSTQPHQPQCLVRSPSWRRLGQPECRSRRFSVHTVDSHAAEAEAVERGF